MSVDELVKGSPTCYLWTLTVREHQLPIKELNARWNDIRKQCFNRPAVVVRERHPGGHGWHIHVIVRDWLPVSWVREQADGSGFGRIHVVEIPSHCANYVSKYVTKQKRESWARSVRLWDCVSRKNWNPTLVKNLRCTSPATDRARAIQSNSLKKMPFAVASLLAFAEELGVLSSRAEHDQGLRKWIGQVHVFFGVNYSDNLVMSQPGTPAPSDDGLAVADGVGVSPYWWNRED
jgi:hypothetical protein